MLCDVSKALKIKNGIDPELVSRALIGRHYWAFDWEFGGNVFHDHVDRAPVVEHVVNVLDMWDFIESAVARFTAKERQQIKKETEREHIEFSGFDGNNESEYLGVAQFLINDLGRFARFKGRDLNSHASSVGRYARMLETFLPMRQALVGRGLTAAQVIQILNSPLKRA